MIRRIELIAVLIATCGVSAGLAAESPYVGLEERPIKALSQEEIAAYEAGEGMGLALAAELNRYPGPKHVLELSDELELTAPQRESTQTAFEEMKTAAKALGRQVVGLERELDQAFGSGEITASSLADLVGRLGELRGQLRLAHLEAHLRMVEILTEHQVVRYVSLRGYGAGHEHTMHHHSAGHEGGR